MELKIFDFNGGFLRKKRFLHDKKILHPFILLYTNQPFGVLSNLTELSKTDKVVFIDMTQILRLH